MSQLVNEDDLEKMHQALQLLNTFLDGQLRVAGPNMSIADFAIVVSVSNMEVSYLIRLHITIHPVTSRVARGLLLFG